jgi:DnaJ-class molecular chaperone
MMHVCSECNGHGSKRMKNDRYRKCRACGGSPFRFQFVAEAGKQPVGGFFLG